MGQQQKSGLATAGMVLGIIGVVLSFIPIINNAAFLLGALALAFGIVGIVQTKGSKRSGRGKAVAAVVLAVATIGFVLVAQSIFSQAIDDATKNVTVENEGLQESSKTSFSIGEAIDFDNKKVTVESVERNWDSGNQFIIPDSGNEYIKAQITIENNTDDEIMYGVYDWKIQNSDGVVKDVDSAVFGVDGALNSGELVAGGKVSGFLVFQVPEGDNGLKFRYEPSFWSDRKLEINL